MSAPDGWGRGHSATPPPGFSGRRLVAPLEWVAFGAGVGAFLCLLLPWFGADLTLADGQEVSLTVSGLDFGLAVVGGALLLLGGLLPVLRYAERALAGASAAPAPAPAAGLSLLAPLFSALGAVLVFLQLVHGYEPLDGSGLVYRKYGVILAFVIALVAGASAVLGHLQARGHRLLPAPPPGAPSGHP